MRVVEGDMNSPARVDEDGEGDTNSPVRVDEVVRVRVG